MKKTDTFSHYREGKSQMQRFLAELDPGNLELHDFDLFDWLLFANNFAQRVNYFDKSDNTKPKGDWGNFFLGDDADVVPRRESLEYKSMKKQVTDLMSGFEQDSNLTPHLTLFVCFLKLLDFSKKAFNNLTKRHLDFYYNEILQIEKNDARADKAYVIFELAKKAIQEKIPGGTLLDGGKDVKGKKRIYKTGEELIANQAKVVEIKSFLNDVEKGELRMAGVANSADGLGEKLPEGSNYWWPFGYNSAETDSDRSIYKKLPKAKLGFSVASSLFDLKEGERTVTLKITFNKNATQKLQSLSKEDIENNINVLCSGEKEWLSGIALKCIDRTESQLELSFTLFKHQPAVVKYNKEVHAEAFQTDLPVVRLMIEGEKYYELYEALSEKSLKNIEISVDVKGVKSVQIENDNGALNSEKPYYPFTAQPVTGSNFYIRCPEMFSKKWKKADITINWKNAPDSIKELYDGYVISPNQNISLKEFEAAERPSIVNDDHYFKADTALLEKEIWYTKAQDIDVFKKVDGAYKTLFSVNSGANEAGTAGAIRVTLKQSSLQDVYPKLYTLALSSDPATKKLIPNEPYIPFAEDIELNYSATESVYSYLSKDSAGEASKTKGVQLYHEDVFGQYEKETETGSIVPVHQNGGELYIGLEALPKTTVSLLIQMLEGSENPLVDTFEEKEFIEWHILSGNKWVDLSDDMLQNETRKFLESGIVKFKIPGDINNSHTRFTDGLVWIRAKSKRSYDAVCKIQGIYTQAVLATFQNQDNDLSHLNNGLEAKTIAKLITRVPQVKSVSQPYNSFDGKYKEADLEFYRRVSERLRHKHRAITQWDYEQLVLQEFPEVFKVKCLNHTSEKSYMAPGHVTLMVVPNIKNKNAFDIYQPRVSRASLNKIQNYVNELNTMHVKAQVVNPNYKEAQVETKVKFFEQYDETFYTRQLDEDIKKYISPWAFTDSKDIDFNVELNVNHLVNYLEQLYYVDYVDEIKILVNNIIQKKTLIEVDPKSILVSAKQHKVTVTDQVCI
ncbi:baseplate J/gp47 family protein [Chryseobacterium arthrosphaerae]|uniref:baseplate J/gp47 family protein n=1 Tax=Chryseobacterium arthrosphaerae TaxID=651561 RepID=UPI0023E0B76C|nr:baseplate J/gp47 family protein [Chryseobacterium arthrosphaerae]WES99609.1 baseplate J/gp47 family protein [Chryseobacterium arthrosphaerae]